MATVRVSDAPYCRAHALVVQSDLPPAGIGATGDPRFSLIWTYTGLPTLTLPYGLSPAGLPLGLQLVAPPNREADLLAIGRKMEAVFEFARRHPLRLHRETAARRSAGE